MAFGQNQGAMFLGTLHAGEQKYMKNLLCGARENGYTKFIEPCCGAFAMSHLAVQAGYKPKEIAYRMIGEESQDFEGEWANEPLAYTKIKGSENEQLDAQIEKAAQDGENEIVAVLKEVRNLLNMNNNDNSEENTKKTLTNISENDIIKADEDIVWKTINGARIPFSASTGKPLNAAGEKIDSETATVEHKGISCKEFKIGNESLYVSVDDNYIVGGCGDRYNGMTLKQANEVASFTPRDYVNSKKQLDGTSANAIRPMSRGNYATHWKGGERDHSGEFPNFTGEQYRNRAQALASCSVGGNIEGYKATSGRYIGSIVRYDRANNEWVRGYEKGPATLFKPDNSLPKHQGDYYTWIMGMETKGN